MNAFSVHASTSASPEVVFRLLAAGETWPTWSPLGSFRLERAGTDGGESVGAIRVFKTGTIKSREEILLIDAPHELRYTALSGMPIREHVARVLLKPTVEGGTSITWEERFEAKVPGTGSLVVRFLRPFIHKCVDGLATYATTAPPD